MKRNIITLFLLSLTLMLPLHVSAALLRPVASTPPLKKAALVVINYAYKTSPLNGYEKDEKAILAGLKAGGFDVVLKHNTDAAAMKQAFTDFKKTASSSDVAFVYFWGHTVGTEGVNYMLPVDATQDNIKVSAIKVADVAASMQNLKSGLLVADGSQTTKEAFNLPKNIAVLLPNQYGVLQYTQPDTLNPFARAVAEYLAMKTNYSANLLAMLPTVVSWESSLKGEHPLMPMVFGTIGAGFHTPLPVTYR